MRSFFELQKQGQRGLSLFQLLFEYCLVLSVCCYFDSAECTHKSIAGFVEMFCQQWTSPPL